MSLTPDEFVSLKKALDESARPLFFFDGDADGLASFAVFLKYKGDGKGVMVSGRPLLDDLYLRRIAEYQPDTIFLLDLPRVGEDFLSKVQQPVHWLDHHKPTSLKLKKTIHYYNPRVHDDSDGRPTSYWAYMTVKKHLWIAMTGIIGDYAWDNQLAHQLREEYPELLPIDITNQGKALFDSPLGTLIRIINLNLKGGVSSAMTSAKILTRIEDPYEILNQITSKGRYLYKRYERVNEHYKNLYVQAQSCIHKDDPFIIFTYHNDLFSLSGELANEIKWRNPKKVVLVGRRNDGKLVMSIRSEEHIVHDALQKALEGTSGHGGGHPKACGAMVLESEFDEFLDRFKAGFNF